MDTVKTYQQIVQDVLLPYADLRYSHGDFHNFPVFDHERGHYLIMSQGRIAISEFTAACSTCNSSKCRFSGTGPKRASRWS